MVFRRILFLLLFLSPVCGWCQSGFLKPVNGLPTKEIYDLLVDKRGFLWIAHDLGVTSYDGVTFTSYSNLEQTSLSATDLLEDKQGRIWFHNFTGQIYYIEQGRMNLLKAYDYKKESYFPRIVLYNNMLVASTQQGIFTCDLRTLESKYIRCAAGPGKGSTSVTVLNDAIIAYGEGNWFIYRGSGALKLAKLTGDSTAYIRSNSSTLTSTTKKDTALLISNPAGIIAGITLHGDELHLVKKTHSADFINTITGLSNGQVWLNLAGKSYAINSPEKQIKGYNLTDIVTDQEGNSWYSSLKNGLLVRRLPQSGGLVPINITSANNPVTALQQVDGRLLLGTQNGALIIYDPQLHRALKTIQLPGNPGTVSYLYKLEGSKYLAATTVNTYEVDIATGKTTYYPTVKTLKQAFKTSKYLFLASARALFIRPRDKQADIKKTSALFKGMEIRTDSSGQYLYHQMRTRAVCFDPATATIYAAFKDGLHTVNQNGITPYLYNNAPVYATGLAFVNGKLFISTINKGLLIIEKNKTTQLTVDDGLTSNTILKLKITGNYIWLLGGGAPKVVDMNTLKLATQFNLTSLTDKLMMGLDVIGKKAYVATPEGFSCFDMTNPVKRFDLTNYLRNVVVNNKPISAERAKALDYFENNLRFDLSVPFFNQSGNIYFRYLLTGTSNPHWQATSPGDRSITFSELSPGKYSFRAYAVHPQYGNAAKQIIYTFIITEQWWKTWWFRLIAVVVVVTLAAYIAGSYFFNRLQFQKAEYEHQLKIQGERQRISAEMHDDVGAGLSAIKLYVQMAETSKDKGVDLTQIGGMINDMADKINEIIWSTSTGNDTVESLIYYIEFQSYKLFEHAGIGFRAVVPIDMPEFVITGEKRRNIYLVIKEFLHNALKHAGASQINLELGVKGDDLLVTIQDDGKGFNPEAKTFKGMGMKNARSRAAKLKARMDIASGPTGTTVTMQIPVG